MRIKISNLTDRMLILVFGFAWLAILAGVLLELWAFHSDARVQIISIPLFIGALLAFLLLGWRLSRFRRRVYGLLRRLVAGDFESGLAASERWSDEITELEALFNKLTEQLRQYDELRTRRIRQLRMTLDLILEHSTEPMVLFDVDKETLTFNAAMAGILDTARQSVPLSTLQNLEPNKPFVELLRRAVEEEKSPLKARVGIQFPGQESVTETDMRIVPFKDKDETVSLAVIFGKRQ